MTDPGPLHRGPSQPERGATLVLVAVAMVVVIVSGALAVDLSAMARRGQELQNAADAAALAGVRTWVETGDQALTNARVNDLLHQNGVDAAQSRVDVTFPSTSEIDVNVVDTNATTFLSGVAGGAGEVERGAAATLEICDQTCARSVEIPPPFESVQALATGDGYKPVLAGNKLYAIHHAGTRVVCVDRATQNLCWDTAARSAYPAGHGERNPQMPHAVVFGDRLWWSSTDSVGHKMFCWDTISDQPCPTAWLLASLPKAAELDYRDRNRGGGTVMVDDLIYVFTDDHRVHCFNPATETVCSGYQGGLSTGLGQANFVPNHAGFGNHGGSIDRVEHQGRIYTTLKIVQRQPLAGEVDCAASMQVPSGRVVLRNVDSGEYLAVDEWDDRYAAPVVDPMIDRARWDVTAQPGGEWRFQNVETGTYLDGDGGFPSLLQTSITPTDDDDWRLFDWNGASWHIENAYWVGGYMRQVGDQLYLEGLASTGGRWQIWPWECTVPNYNPPTSPSLPYDSGTWLDCWDTVIDAPCGDFEPSRVHSNGLRFNGRLFFYRDAGGDPIGVCSSGFEGDLSQAGFEIDCRNLSGSGRGGLVDTGLTTRIAHLASSIGQTVGTSLSSWGDPHWNEAANRLFFPSHRTANTIYCWDFDSDTFCGERQGLSPVHGTTQDYGYVSVDTCVIGLGHNSIFWAFSAEATHEECKATTTTTTIHPCICGPRASWGELNFDVDLNLYDRFDVRFLDPAGDPISIEGRTTWSLIDHGLVIDLRSVPTSYPSIKIVINVESDLDPWATGPQTFTIEFDNAPVLTG